MSQNLTSQMRTVDTLLILKDAGLVAASAAATVATVAKILDVGAIIPTTNQPVPELNGAVLIDVSALEVASGDEKYTIILQGSASSSFASGIVNLCQIELGALTPMLGGAALCTTGRYLMPFTTNRNGVTYRYLRLYTTVVGTIATGINYTAHLAKM